MKKLLTLALIACSLPFCLAPVSGADLTPDEAYQQAFNLVKSGAVREVRTSIPGLDGEWVLYAEAGVVNKKRPGDPAPAPKTVSAPVATLPAAPAAVAAVPPATLGGFIPPDLQPDGWNPYPYSPNFPRAAAAPASTTTYQQVTVRECDPATGTCRLVTRWVPTSAPSTTSAGPCPCQASGQPCPCTAAQCGGPTCPSQPAAAFTQGCTGCSSGAGSPGVPIGDCGSAAAGRQPVLRIFGGPGLFGGRCGCR